MLGMWKKRVFTLFVIFGMLLPLFGGAQAQEMYEQMPNTGFDIPQENMPREMGASKIDAYVPETGHSVTGYMLDYWRANGAASVYGNPISQPYGMNDLYSQAFERGVFQWVPYWYYSDEPVIRLQPIVRENMKRDREARRSDGRRHGADRSRGWISATRNESRANDVYSLGGWVSPRTGYGIAGRFAEWYQAHEGMYYLGAPVSETMMYRGVPAQMFEGGILLLQEDEVRIAPLPAEHPDRYGIDTTPIEQGERPVYSESLFYTAPNPYGIDPTQIPDGPKRIEVDIDQQVMRVYQGDVLVMETLVSTGQDPNGTEVGFFHVRMKYESQTMEGFADSSGEVITLGNDPSQGGELWSVSDVPHIMYFNYEAEAIHGAYWHSNFGNRMSHGCVNLPLDVAWFVWEFSPLGTPVTVTGTVYDDTD